MEIASLAAKGTALLKKIPFSNNLPGVQQARRFLAAAEAAGLAMEYWGRGDKLHGAAMGGAALLNGGIAVAEIAALFSGGGEAADLVAGGMAGKFGDMAVSYVKGSAEARDSRRAGTRVPNAPYERKGSQDSQFSAIREQGLGFT